ncbi:MAG: FAD-dependent oxidoreductase [Pseudomonadota bacterium]
MPNSIVIVGAGQAGGWVAKTLRDKGYEGALTLIGDEPHHPYERPPLSKAVLAGEAEDHSVHLFNQGIFADQNIDFRPNQTVDSIDRDRGVVKLDGEELAYDKLVLATGGRPRDLPFLSHISDRLHTLRDLADARDLRQTLQAGGHLTIIGGGWIGLEVAATARKLGCKVTVIEAAPRLCARAASEPLSAFLLDLHLANGVTVHLNAGVEAINEQDGKLICRLSDGQTFETDAVLVGIGIVPNSELAEEAGLKVENGIMVDANGQTDDPSIYAVGDVAHRFSTLDDQHRRLESWANAQNEGIAVAHALLGLDRPPEDIPWFWSDQHGCNIQILGIPPEDSESVFREGGPGQTCFYLEGERLVGVHACDDPMAIKVAKRLMTRDLPVDAAKLADPAISLKSLLKS